jgi:hypothetical protein
MLEPHLDFQFKYKINSATEKNKNHQNFLNQAQTYIRAKKEP